MHKQQTLVIDWAHSLAGDSYVKCVAFRLFSPLPVLIFSPLNLAIEFHGR